MDPAHSRHDLDRVLILYATGVAWVLECEMPSAEAKRALGPVVSRMATEELASTGRVGDSV